MSMAERASNQFGSLASAACERFGVQGELPFAPPLRVLFALPGLHRVHRGAEVAFESLGRALAYLGCHITLIGAGQPQPEAPYRFLHAPAIDRRRFERFPRLPVLRGQYAYEELTFLPALLRHFRPSEYDVTVTCSYPFTNWALRARRSGRRPAHVFVTQNGDHPAARSRSEFRLFDCDGLVCTTPAYYDRYCRRWPCALIPNGVDLQHFAPAPPQRRALALPENPPLLLMVSALIPSKRVLDGIRCAATVPGAHLLIAGDGPMRQQTDELGQKLLGQRYHRRVVAPGQMPLLYQAADTVLHMAREEPFGNVYLEALACGKPLIAHDNPATRWITQDQARLVDSDDSDSVAAAIGQALSSDDPSACSARRTMVARRFAWPVVARRYAAFFQELGQK